MRAATKSIALIVRRRSYWRQNVILSLAAFGLTVAAVYLISQNCFQKSVAEKGSKAIAIIEQKPLYRQDNLPIDFLSDLSLNPQKIETRIFSPTFIQHVLDDCGIDVTNTAENVRHDVPIISPQQLRQGLSIHAKPGQVPGARQIILELKLTQSPVASRIARALADRLVCEYRTFWATEARNADLEALNQADQARQLHNQAVEKLQAFKDKEIALKQEQSMPESQPSETQTQQLAPSQSPDNAAWIQLNSQLDLFRRQEAKMLENKTPLHPDIQNIRESIADLEQQLVSTPRFNDKAAEDYALQQELSFSKDKTSPLENEKENQDLNNNEKIAAGVDQDKTTETLKLLQDSLESAEREYLNLLHCERQIFEAGRREPIFLVHISPVAIAKTEHKSNRGLVGLMFFSGFAMAAGIGVFSSGVSIEPVLATIADVELLLPAPIIGAVPSKDRSFNPVTRRRRQTICRWSMILFGGMIVLGCVGCVCWFFANMG